MTLTSGLIGGLLALGAARMNGVDYLSLGWFNFFLALVAILLAHAINNMLNDYFDLKGGVDEDEYVRALYSPHPILSGYTTERGLLSTVLVFNLIFLAITVYLAWVINLWALAFGVLGVFFSFAYVAPPFNFKKIGLGEPSVFIVWGPLMIGITFYAMYGSIPGWFWVSSLPYAITVTTVLLGKHIDKLSVDKAKGIHTLPVLLGDRWARLLTQLLLILFYPIVAGLVIAEVAGVGLLLVLLGLPRLINVVRILSQPKPSHPPPNWSVWPLYYVGWAFWHNRLAGGLFVLGLLANLFIPADWLYISSITG